VFWQGSVFDEKSQQLWNGMYC